MRIHKLLQYLTFRFANTSNFEVQRRTKYDFNSLQGIIWLVATILVQKVSEGIDCSSGWKVALILQKLNSMINRGNIKHSHYFAKIAIVIERLQPIYPCNLITQSNTCCTRTFNILLHKLLSIRRLWITQSFTFYSKFHLPNIGVSTRISWVLNEVKLCRLSAR